MASFGVDQLDYTAKYASAYIEFPAIVGNETSNFARYVANYISMPSGCSLTFKRDKNYSGTFTAFNNTAKDETNDAQYYLEETIEEARAFELRIEFTVSSNNAPIIESFLIQTT